MDARRIPLRQRYPELFTALDCLQVGQCITVPWGIYLARNRTAGYCEKRGIVLAYEWLPGRTGTRLTRIVPTPAQQRRIDCAAYLKGNS